jgi:hypothetical protein
MSQRPAADSVASTSICNIDISTDTALCTLGPVRPSLGDNTRTASALSFAVPTGVFDDACAVGSASLVVQLSQLTALMQLAQLRRAERSTEASGL